MGSLTSHADHNTEDAGDGAYGLSSLSEKTRTSNHLQMLLQRQHVLLSYFKTLSFGLVWESNPGPPARESGAQPTQLTSRQPVMMPVGIIGKNPVPTISLSQRALYLNKHKKPW